MDDAANVNGNASKPEKNTTTKKSSKRARPQDDDDEDDNDDPPPAKKSKQSKQSAPAQASAPVSTPASRAISAKVPIDHQVPNARQYTVYVDGEGVMYDATLNMSDAGKNNNKFYRVQLLEAKSNKGNFFTWTRWGRVGENGQSAMLGEGVTSDEAMFTIRTRSSRIRLALPGKIVMAHQRMEKYVYLEVNYGDEDEEDGKDGVQSTPEDDDSEGDAAVFAPSKLSQPVQRLMELIFNVSYFNATMAELDYDANKMPLGKLVQEDPAEGIRSPQGACFSRCGSNPSRHDGRNPERSCDPEKQSILQSRPPRRWSIKNSNSQRTGRH